MICGKRSDFGVIEEKTFPFKYNSFILKIAVYNDYSIDFYLIDTHVKDYYPLGLCVYSKLITRSNIHTLPEIVKRELEHLPTISKKWRRIIIEFYNMAYKIYKSIFFKRKEE